MSLASFAKRYIDGYNDCGYGDDFNNDCNDDWYIWGRWVLLAAIIVVVLLIFFVFSCITARRRRNAGRQPWRGTAWMAPQHGPVQYYGPGGSNAQQPQTYEANQAAPPYSASNAGYYGQQSGYEMQPPANAYHPGQGGEQVYAPPTGPPPTKEYAQ